MASHSSQSERLLYISPVSRSVASDLERCLDRPLYSGFAWTCCIVSPLRISTTVASNSVDDPHVSRSKVPHSEGYDCDFRGCNCSLWGRLHFAGGCSGREKEATWLACISHPYGPMRKYTGTCSRDFNAQVTHPKQRLLAQAYTLCCIPIYGLSLCFSTDPAAHACHQRRRKPSDQPSYHPDRHQSRPWSRPANQKDRKSFLPLSSCEVHLTFELHVYPWS